MAGKLDFQAIVDLVGDKLRELFATGDLAIHWRDENTELVHSLYVYEHGQRLANTPVQPYDPEKPINKALNAGRPVVMGDRAAMDALGIRTVPGTDPSLACVFVPVMVGSRLVAAISIESFEREHAFDEAQVHLLSTIAASMGVALENARLLAETQRGARESAALSDVGRDLSSTLDLPTVMDRIAAHAKALLAASDSAIFVPAADGKTYHAIVAIGGAGAQIKATSITLGEGIIGQLLQSGRAELINDTQADPRAVQIPGTQPQRDERMMVVPLLSGDVVQGAMAVWRTGGEPFEPRELAFLQGLSRQAAVALQNARLFNETSEALERQTASAEVLQVISGSMADPKPVFDKILDSCAKLFGAGDPAVCLVDGEELRIGAYRGKFTEEVEQAFPRPLAGTISDMAIRQGSVLYRPSVLAAGDMPGYVTDVARERGDFSVVNAPMSWSGNAIGTIDIICTPPRAFSDAELGLVRTFADQAAIAIQNARLFNDTQEALARQTATAEILRVISGSPSSVQPVFDAIVGTAVRLLACDLTVAVLRRGNTHSMVAGATRDGSPLGLGAYDNPIDPDADFPSRVFTTGQMLHVPDWSSMDLPAKERQIRAASGMAASLMVPMVREGECIGVLVFGRKTPGPFRDTEIALAESFADQALIAIENVRLFNETKDALEQQTATAEVLDVISHSMADASPVFEKIVECCDRLFPAQAFALGIVDERDQVAVPVFRVTDAARRRLGEAGAAAVESRIRAAFPRPLAGTLTEQAIRSGRLVEIRDLRDESIASQPAVQAALQMNLGTSVVIAPLMWEGRGVGTLSMFREEVEGVRERENALLKTFADQAVIAIQNARLINETREALERQTATAEILRVISGSVTDTQPVFDAIVESCQRLFAGKAVALVFPNGQHLEAVAYSDDSGTRRGPGMLKPWPLDRGSGAGTCILDSRVVNVADTAEGAKEFSRMQDLAIALGYKSCLFVPLLREAQAIGCITILRATAGRFDDQEVALAQTFADQAVIAIQNARLFNETKEALERQTATAEVLRVISESPTDVQPVLDAVAERAGVLCHADGSRVWLVVDGQLRAMTSYGPAYATGPGIDVLPLGRTSIGGRTVLERRDIHVEDVVPLMESEYPDIREIPGALWFPHRAERSSAARGRGRGRNSSCSATRCARSHRPRSACCRRSPTRR